LEVYAIKLPTAVMGKWVYRITWFVAVEGRFSAAAAYAIRAGGRCRSTVCQSVS